MRRIPTSTYRLQLHRNFRFDDAASITDYLSELGISHVYCSPYLQAATGSMHGYDVVDHQRVNVELGGADAHERFCKRLGEAGLRQILDIVPNHMSLSRENRFWWDVLENGSSSRYASFFDIDWEPHEERLRNKVLVPVLGEQYGSALKAGAMTVVRHGNDFQVECSAQNFPIAPQSLPVILTRAGEIVESDTLSFLAASFARLPAPENGDRPTILARERDKRVLKGLLARLCLEDPAIGDALDEAVAEMNENTDALDDFLNRQSYRLAYWKTSDQQLGYRRFFDVNTLIGLRAEREHVFNETHTLLLDWLCRGVVDGVRVDHPDGLRDPVHYLRRLRECAPEAWIVAEKILAPGEFLRESWPLQGTSGYDFMNVALGVLVSPQGMEVLSGIYEQFTGEPASFAAIAHEKKMSAMQEALGSDVNRLTSLLVEICEANRDRRDYTRTEMRRAIREVASCFDIYRTYVEPERGEIAEEDLEHIGRAIECAKRRRQDVDGGLFDFLGDVLEGKVKGGLETEFAMRFQQFTPPVMAKGVEDTAFYCYNRLVAMNEVGGNPGSNGIEVTDFHTYNMKMQETHPETMVALSTHDTKRSDDVRARLAVLSEMPETFGAALYRWSRIADQLRADLKLGEYPDRNTEYMFYQTLIGAWPISLERLQEYMLKAVREAKQRTTWTANNAEFEVALQRFVDAAMENTEFVTDIKLFVQTVKTAGRVNSLSQTLMKHTVPGVPDLYQGGELWDLSLVDPDNRRAVDYRLRAKLLHEIKRMPAKQAAEEAIHREEEGLTKLWTIHRSLCVRGERPQSFGAAAAYTPLKVEGTNAAHAIAYLRNNDVVTVVPRLTAGLVGWEQTSVDLPAGIWTNRFTGVEVAGGRAAICDLLQDFPVALLVKD